MNAIEQQNSLKNSGTTTNKPYPAGSEVESFLREERPPEWLLIYSQNVASYVAITIDNEPHTASSESIQVIIASSQHHPDAFQWPCDGIPCVCLLDEYSGFSRLSLRTELLNYGAKSVEIFLLQAGELVNREIYYQNTIEQGVAA